MSVCLSGWTLSSGRRVGVAEWNKDSPGCSERQEVMSLTALQINQSLICSVRLLNWFLSQINVNNVWQYLYQIYFYPPTFQLLLLCFCLKCINENRFFSLIWRSQIIFGQKVLTSCSLYYIQNLIKDLYELRQTNVCECCRLSGWMWAAQSSISFIDMWAETTMTALTCCQRPSGSDWSCFCAQVPLWPNQAGTLYLQTVWSWNGLKWLPDLFRSITFSLRSIMLINAELLRLSYCSVCGWV